MILLELPENSAGRDFIVGDIHGHFAALDEALAKQAFDPSRDRLVAVGDLIDRGPQSARALEFLARPWFFSVRGNHEQAMLEWLGLVIADAPLAELRAAAARHASFGGDWAMPLLTAAMRGAREEIHHWHAALSRLPAAIVIPRKGRRTGVVHATVPGGDWDRFAAALAAIAPVQWDMPAPQLPPNITQPALWARRPLDDSDDRDAGVSGIDRVFAGHNVVPAPQRIGNFHMIETAVWAGHALTLVDLDNWPPQRGNPATARLKRWWGGRG